jgi:hypothetical protein
MKMILRSSIVVLVGFLTACSSGYDNKINGPNDPQTGTPALLATGGTSTSGTGGAGGSVSIQSYGAVRVLNSGTVDASFDSLVSAAAPSFGTNPAVVSGGTTTVVLDADDVFGNLCSVTGDTNLYIGDGNSACGDAGDSVVTGLAVNAGATLALVDQGFGYATLRFQNDLVISGTLTSDMNATTGLDVEANIIVVENGGSIIASATTVDANAGEIWLGNGSGSTKQIINRGTIEARGLGSGGGGYLCFEPEDLFVNKGTIDVSGGSSDTGAGGRGGELDVYVDRGDFYSSGTVRMNGGEGATSGGDSESGYENYNGYSAYIETAYIDNSNGRNGDIIISGTWEANGGDGTNGNGGYGGYIYLQTNAMGAVTINAVMSVRGGDSISSGSFPGGSTYGIEIYTSFDPYGSGTFSEPSTPGNIRIAGKYDLRGGNGDEMGGSGGSLYIQSASYNSSNEGSDVELLGFLAMNLNGGDGANGGSAASYAFQVNTNSPNGMPAGPITNEANIEARGGNGASTPNSYGGSGGNVEMITNGINDPSEIITNSGTIDISGGHCDLGGNSSMINLGAQYVTNSGNLAANGGNGTTYGGNGGNINLNSYDATTPTTNTGTLSVAGGTPGGSDGSVNIDTGGPI